MKEYVTIAEYARIKGISKQAVYKQLKNRLKPYTTTVDGQKVLYISLLTDAEREQIKPDIENGEQQEQTTSKLIEMLQQELQQKDEQLARKDEQLAKMDARLAEANALLLVSQQRVAQLEAPKEKKSFWKRLFG